MTMKTIFAAAAALTLSAGVASAVTLDFDTGVSEFNAAGQLTGYSQGGLVFTITETGRGSSGANLFNTACGVNPNGQTASCFGNDDGDLVPAVGDADGVAGNALIRQDDTPRTADGVDLSDDAGSIGSIVFTLVSGNAFSILGFSAVDNETFNISTGGSTLGEIVNTLENETTALTFAVPSPLIGIGQSFSVNYFGSGAVDSIVLAPVPLPAGGLLLVAGLGGLVAVRRRNKA